MLFYCDTPWAFHVTILPVGVMRVSIKILLKIYDGMIQILLMSEHFVDDSQVEYMLHHANMSVKSRPPYTLLLYGKTEFYRGIHYFHILL